MYRKFLCFLFSILAISNVTFASSLPELSSDGAYLIETTTNTVLYSKNGNITFYPASTTKVLTSLAIAQDLPMDQIVTKSQTAVNEVPSDSSQIGLNVGAQYTVYDGLHAVLMSSDNFVCYDLALTDSGSIPAFAVKMNTLAANAGASNFNFITPHGYHDENHYVTPSALAHITQAAFSNPIVSEIAGTESYNFTVQNTGQTIPLKHTSALLDPDSPYYNEHVIASKTGYHTPAGRTLVAKSSYGDMTFISVVMRADAPKQFEDMNALLTYASENFAIGVDAEGNRMLTNKSYSPWAKTSIEKALNEGWLTETTQNYTEPVSKYQFLTMLSHATNDSNELLEQMLSSLGESTYAQNTPMKRKELASLIYEYLSPLDLTSTPFETKVTDITTLSHLEQAAITFCIQSSLINLRSDDTFKPNDTISYEEAICIVNKLLQFEQRYKNFSASFI